ncbi:MAG: hypothetical protein JNL72_06050 [Flavipsychrobacter sp.]|nr:hypothetical protein [Flavipsychrobacter sp.]
MLDDIIELPIWKHYKGLSNKQEFSLERLFETPYSLLDRYYETFPHYTLHNKQHLKNVLRIIGEILGDKVKELSELECLIIIISVGYHDIGMVFAKSELKNISQELSFIHFLDKNLKAKLEYEENGSELSENLAEWYCRWMHAKRVWNFINHFDQNKWKNISLRTSVGNICESHNESADFLNNKEKFPRNFLGEADLCFCAILLRLGDILDFDSTRTPISVYEFLDLDSPKNDAEEISKKEWNKHLSSNGFSIKHENNNTDLLFIAGPEHPQVEKNIHNFLDIIDNELYECAVLLESCSDKWRKIQLPKKINRGGIISTNYKKGDYRLSLDEKQIIHLLTGENLYSNNYIFIRELLQNAIDTSRMREYHQHSNGDLGFKISPVEINTWVDDKGFRWVRFDDFGMGLNEYIIQNHLLKKGNSFYKSDFFKLQKNHYKKTIKKDFTPISRFGIGLLSCFMLGDTIEINSRSIAIKQTNTVEQKIRLSINGLEGQYFMQIDSENHTPLPMPNINPENSFRNEFGTSIAVRISSKKDSLHFEKQLNEVLNEIVLCSPIDIYLSGKKVNIGFDILDEQIVDYSYIPFTPLQKKEIEKTIDFEINSDMGIEIIPIDLTSNCPNNNLKGQIAIIRLKCSYLEEHNLPVNTSYSFHFSKSAFRITFEKNTFTNGNKDTKVRSLSFFNELNTLIQTKNLNKFLSPQYNHSNYRNYLHLIHNGINIPNFSEISEHIKLRFVDGLFDYNSRINRGDWRQAIFYTGLIYLQDDLIPNLTVARNSIKGFNFSIYSNLVYGCRQLNEFRRNSSNPFDFFDYIYEHFPISEIKTDYLIINGYWNDEKIIPIYGHGFVSVNDIKLLLEKNSVELDYKYRSSGFVVTLFRALVELNFEVEFDVKDVNRPRFYIKSSKQINMTISSIDSYGPMLFVRFDGDDMLYCSDMVNINHWLPTWMYSNQKILIDNYETYFLSLYNYIKDKNIHSINSILNHFRKVLTHSAPPNLAISDLDYPH